MLSFYKFSRAIGLTRVEELRLACIKNYKTDTTIKINEVAPSRTVTCNGRIIDSLKYDKYKRTAND